MRQTNQFLEGRAVVVPDAVYALALITRGALDLKVLSTHHLPLSQNNEGIDLLERQEAIKVCFHPWE